MFELKVAKTVVVKDGVHQVIVELPVRHPTHCRVVDKFNVVRVINKKLFITEAANDE